VLAAFGLVDCFSHDVAGAGANFTGGLEEIAGSHDTEPQKGQAADLKDGRTFRFEN
jgi:hypothetical protein